MALDFARLAREAVKVPVSEFSASTSSDNPFIDMVREDSDLITKRQESDYRVSNSGVWRRLGSMKDATEKELQDLDRQIRYAGRISKPQRRVKIDKGSKADPRWAFLVMLTKADMDALSARVAREASEAEASEAEASEAEASEAEASEAEASQAEASQAEASQAEASQAEASQAEASQAEASEAEASVKATPATARRRRK